MQAGKGQCREVRLNPWTGAIDDILSKGTMQSDVCFRRITLSTVTRTVIIVSAKADGGKLESNDDWGSSNGNRKKETGETFLRQKGWMGRLPDLGLL